MKEMNSLTHSCMHSFASLAIFAFSGRAIFMMRATGAKLRMLASAAAAFAGLGVVCGGEELDCGEADDMARLQGGRLVVGRAGAEMIRRAGEADARLTGMRASSVGGLADGMSRARKSESRGET